MKSPTKILFLIILIVALYKVINVFLQYQHLNSCDQFSNKTQSEQLIQNTGRSEGLESLNNKNIQQNTSQTNYIESGNSQIQLRGSGFQQDISSLSIQENEKLELLPEPKEINLTNTTGKFAMICYDDNIIHEKKIWFGTYRQKVCFDIFTNFIQMATQQIQAENNTISNMGYIKHLTPTHFEQINKQTQDLQTFKVTISDLVNKAYEYTFVVNPIKRAIFQRQSIEESKNKKLQLLQLIDVDQNFIPEISIFGGYNEPTYEKTQDGQQALSYFNNNRLLIEFVCQFDAYPVVIINKFDYLIKYLCHIFDRNFNYLLKNKRKLSAKTEQIPKQDLNLCQKKQYKKKQQNHMQKQFKQNHKQQYQQPQFWEFSAVNLSKCYRQVILHLASRHKLDLQEPFSNKMVTSALEVLLKDGFWSELYSSFRHWVQRKFNFVFVQENATQKMAHLQFMHNNIVKSFMKKSEGSSHGPVQETRLDFDSVKRVVRKYMYSAQQRNGSLTIDLLTGEVLHQFTQKPLQFGYSEYSSFLTVLMEHINKSRHYLKSVKLQVQPLGLYLQARYHDNEWKLATKSSLRVNESKFMSDDVLQTVFCNLLQKHELSLDDFNKDHLYTFSLVYNKYLPFQVEDALYLVSVFDVLHKSATKEDKIKQSKLPRLPSQIVMFENSSYYQMKKQLEDGLDQLFSKYTKEFPVYSVVIKVKKHLFELENDVAEAYSSVSEKLQTLKGASSSDDYELQLQTFLKEASKALPKNRFLQSYSE